MRRPFGHRDCRVNCGYYSRRALWLFRLYQTSRHCGRHGHIITAADVSVIAAIAPLRLHYLQRISRLCRRSYVVQALAIFAAIPVNLSVIAVINR